MEKKKKMATMSCNESVNATNMVASVKPEDVAWCGLLNHSALEVFCDDENAKFLYETKEESGQIRKCLKKLGYKVVDSYEYPYAYEEENTRVIESNMPVGVYLKLDDEFKKFEQKVCNYLHKRIKSQLADAVDGDGKCLIGFMGREEWKSVIKDNLGGFEGFDRDDDRDRDILLFLYEEIQMYQSICYNDAIVEFAVNLDVFVEFDEIKAFEVTFDKTKKFVF